MPIEIKELVIRATVNNKPPSGNGSASQQQPSGNEADQEAIISACVEQVLQILKDKVER